MLLARAPRAAAAAIVIGAAASFRRCVIKIRRISALRACPPRVAALLLPPEPSLSPLPPASARYFLEHGLRPQFEASVTRGGFDIELLVLP